VAPDGFQAAGSGPRAAVAHGPQPRPGLPADAVGEAVELAVQPALEGGAPVIGQHAHLLEHLGGPFDADVPGPQCREDLGVADSVADGVPGQHDDQRPADAQADPAFPASGLTSPAGQVGRPAEPRVVRVGAGVLVETGEVLAGFEQPWLEPPDGGTPGGRRWRFARSAPPVVLTGRPLGPADLHPVEDQLVAAECPGLQNRDRSSGQPAGEPGFAAGLLPAQPAVAVLDREHAAAS
jgi:hypothetical protein